MKINLWGFILIMTLSVLAASPFGVLGHELWHVYFISKEGFQPQQLCLSFGTPSFAYVSYFQSNTTFTPEQIKKLDAIDETVATVIGFTILFILSGVFAYAMSLVINNES